MTIKISLFLCVALFPSIFNSAIAAPPQFRKFTNSHGSYIGSETTLRNGNIIYRDRSGRPMAYGTQSNRKSTIYSDRNGSYIFRETFQNNRKNANSTFYNRSGKPIGHSTNQNVRGRR